MLSRSRQDMFLNEADINKLNNIDNNLLKNIIMKCPEAFYMIQKDREDYNELKELYQFLTM